MPCLQDDEYCQSVGEKREVWMLPKGLERTTCFYPRYVMRGPKSIIEVSCQIELAIYRY